MNESKVYWITGLSGAGKSTIGNLLVERLKKVGKTVVYLDGDTLRNILSASKAHNKEQRIELAMTYSRLCQMLVNQGVNVVCATISMFDEVRTSNRKNIDRYVEIYIKVPITVLIERDQKNLYSKALAGEQQNVLGINEKFEEPLNADIVLENDGSCSPEKVMVTLWDLLYKTGN